jgi:hypothetical protein
MNPIFSQHEYKDHLQPLRKLQYELMQKLLVRAGASSGKFSALEPACSTGQDCATEKRKAQWVQFYINLLSVSEDVDNFPDITKCSLSIGSSYELIPIPEPEVIP